VPIAADPAQPDGRLLVTTDGIAAAALADHETIALRPSAHAR
jgi:hypothetical protein